MPSLMNNLPLNKSHPPATVSRAHNPPRTRTSGVPEDSPLRSKSHIQGGPEAYPSKRSSHVPPEALPGKNSNPRPRRKGRCQSCLPPPRRSTASTHTPSSSRDNVPRTHRPQGALATASSARAKDLVISNPIPIEGPDAPVPRGRRPGNLVPIIPFAEINRGFSPDSSDLSSNRSRTASEARTPISDLSLTTDTDITSVGGSSGEEGGEEGQSTLSYGATSTTSTGYDSGYTSSSTGGYTSSSMGGSRISGSKMTANMHIHRMSMNMDSRLQSETAANMNLHTEGTSGPSKQRARPAPLNLDAASKEIPGGKIAVRTSTQSADIPLHMAHPGNRQSAVVQFSDPAYAHHVATLQRSMSSAEKRRSVRLVPKDQYEDAPPTSVSSSDEISEAPLPAPRRITAHAPGRHSVYGVPPPAPTPPMSTSDEYTEKSMSIGTPAQLPTGVTSDDDDLTSTGGAVSGVSAPGGVRPKKSFGQKAREVLLLPPLVTVLVVDKAWRKMRGKKGPRPMGEVPGVWPVLNKMAPN
ncbi:hypothetical protein BGX38DRAFT_380178 [Terfezia claveryi]|nr:hypothetical protein BGX38DRAFT_380178 [Terfezia claveryi]